jgi:hypothetical protein
VCLHDLGYVCGRGMCESVEVLGSANDQRL